MSRMMFGMETEYAIHNQRRQGSSVDRQSQVWQLIDAARLNLKYLSDFGPGMFLENGSRFYVDCGNHPELSTPECTDPWQIVGYILAGENMLLALGQETETLGNKVSFAKCNVDYTGAGTTWGCHESYLHRSAPDKISAEIIPHLVSRVIYTGAGGFNSLAAGLNFTLSPRVPHLEAVLSEHSTSARGIFHTKDESLSREGYHRLHLICGESLCSQTAMWLKVATTALVVAMADAGVNPGRLVELRAPLTALSGFAADPQCQAQALVTDRQWMSAIAIQRVYLACAEQHLGERFMPEWAGEACRQWRMILDRLEGGPEAVNTTLDWAIKLTLYRDFAKRQGFTWEAVADWTRIHKRMHKIIGSDPAFWRGADLEKIMREAEPGRAQSLRLYLKQKGLQESNFSRFLRLRQQLFEIDTRFGELGASGIFAQLDRSGVLAHEIDGLADVKEFATNPPAEGRARVRGNVISRLPASEEYQCDWQGIWDRLNDRYLDLSDPFTTMEHWHSLKERPEAMRTLIPEALRERMRYLQGTGYACSNP